MPQPVTSQKRLPKAMSERVNGRTNQRIFESIALDRPSFLHTYVGRRHAVEIFDLDDTYSSGLSLASNAEFSGNNITEAFTVYKTSGTPPSEDNYPSYFPTSPTYWKMKALDQTTALDGSYQCRIDKSGSPHKLRLTATGSSAEITSMADILSAGQFLVVIYRRAIGSISSIPWTEV